MFSYTFLRKANEIICIFIVGLNFYLVPWLVVQDIWQLKYRLFCRSKIVSEYDQEIPQSKTADTPWIREEEPLNHHETPGIQIKQSNQLSLPHQDDCNTRMDIK